MRLIEHGIKPSFIEAPPAFKAPPYIHSPGQLHYLQHWAYRLVAQGTLALCSSKPRYICPVFCIPKLSTGDDGSTTPSRRPVFDATIFNAFIDPIPYSSLTMETIDMAISVLQPNGSVIQFDISDACYSIGLGPSISGELGFAIHFKDGIRCFAFLAAPMGLRISAWAWDLVFGSVIRHFRRLGFRCICFGDDGFIAREQRLIRATGIYACSHLVRPVPEFGQIKF